VSADVEAGQPPPMEGVLLTDTTLFPYGIAVDDTNVYFTSSANGTLERFAKSAAAPVAPVVVAMNLLNAGRVALDATFAYVVVRGTADSFLDGSIVRIAKDGSTTQTLASALHGADGIALDGDEIYIACNGSVVGGSYQGDGSIVRVKADGSSPQEVLLTNEAFSSTVVLDATNVYFTDRYSGTVSRCSKASCASTRVDLVTGLDEPIGLAVTGTTLVFAEYHGGRLLTSGIDGSNLKPLNVSRGMPHDVDIAGANAYWLETLTLEVNVQPVAATTYAFDTLAKTTQDPSVLALDPTAPGLYVTDSHAGTITVAPRPN
jgi:hypothetical protein